MDIPRKLGFDDQVNPASRKRSAVGLFDQKPQVRGLDVVRHPLGQFREKLADHVVRREAILIFCFKEFFADCAFGIDEKEAGQRHPLTDPSRFFVENLESSDDLGIGIGEQGEVDLASVGEILQDLRAVIADRRQPDPLLFKSLFRLLELDELRLAVGSPIGRTKKEKNGAVGPFQRFVGLFPTQLVVSGKGGCLRSNGESDRASRGRARRRVLGKARSQKTKQQKHTRHGLHFASTKATVCLRSNMGIPAPAIVEQTTASDQIFPEVQAIEACQPLPASAAR